MNAARYAARDGGTPAHRKLPAAPDRNLPATTMYQPGAPRDPRSQGETLFETARARVRAAAGWICRSQDVTGGGGSAAYYCPLWGWAAPYPETTGYIIPTLYRCAEQLGTSEYAGRAERMARWLVGIQAPAGWFAGGLWRGRRPARGSVFNTGQILFGLLDAAKRTGDPTFASAAEKAARWLIGAQEESGHWRQDAFPREPSANYYAHVLWPLGLYWKQYRVEAARQCVLRGLGAILADRTPAGTFRRWSFDGGGVAFTHTIAYTLQGLIESAILVGSWMPAGAAAMESAEILLRKYESSKCLGGAYGMDWKPTRWYACLTGHCQLASMWLRLFERTGDPRFLNVAIKALDDVASRQRWCPARANRHGAIAGSAPFVGRYMTLRYPNWAAKFFIDAILELDANVQRLAAPTMAP